MSTIRTYRASSVREALALVRAELGDNALILGQREIRKRPFPWRKVKVVAELTVADTAIMLPSERVEANSGTNSRFKSSRIADLSRGLCRADADRAGPAFSDRDSVPVPGPSTETAPPKRDDPFHLYTQLIEQDVDESVARHLVGEVQAHSSVTGEGGFTGRCRDLIEQSLSCSGPIRVTPGRRRIAALVGPTGVGKTTTVAKLAANFRLRDRIRVGLITVDTFRVAAVEQLRTYAELIDVPMRVVSSPREMPQALDDLSDVDLVLIDTAGRSPSDDLRIQELRAFLQAAHADEAHLVVSLTSDVRNLQLTVERFSRVGPTALLLTKLDEACGPGAVLTAANVAGLPVSYVTTGQTVPDDIETADAGRIAQRVLPGEKDHVAKDCLPMRGAAAMAARIAVTSSTAD